MKYVVALLCLVWNSSLAGSNLHFRKGESIQFQVTGCRTFEYSGFRFAEQTGEYFADCFSKVCFAELTNEFQFVWSQKFYLYISPGNHILQTRFQGTIEEVSEQIRNYISFGICAKGVVNHLNGRFEVIN